MVIIALMNYYRNCMKISKKYLLIDRDIFSILDGDCLRGKNKILSGSTVTIAYLRLSTQLSRSVSIALV